MLMLLGVNHFCCCWFSCFACPFRLCPGLQILQSGSYFEVRIVLTLLCSLCFFFSLLDYFLKRVCVMTLFC